MLVAKRFLQKVDLDYSEVYALIARTESVRLVIVIANARGWSTFHLNVKSLFLNEPIDELIFVTQPTGFVIKSKEYMVYRLINLFMA